MSDEDIKKLVELIRDRLESKEDVLAIGGELPTPGKGII